MRLSSMYKNIEDSHITISELMLPSYSNFSGKIHGGYILNLMDQIAFACASKHSEHYCVTASVNKVDFLHPVEVGELLTLKSSINYTGNTSMVVGVRVESENIKTRIIKHCNSSYFTLVAKDDHGNKAKVPGIILKTEDHIRRFARNIARKALVSQWGDKFEAENFVVKDYFEQLKDENAKIEIH